MDDGGDLILDELNPCDIFRSVDQRDPPGRRPTRADQEHRVSEKWIVANARKPPLGTSRSASQERKPYRSGGSIARRG